MWANGAAESLFGEPGKAPAGARAARSAPTSRRSAVVVDAAASTAPPVSDTAPTFAVGASGRGPGRLRRVWTRCLALLGRRVSEART